MASFGGDWAERPACSWPSVIRWNGRCRWTTCLSSLVIFRYFQIPKEHQYRILFWGILGAVLMRLGFILAGAVLISRFDFVLPLFGIFLDLHRLSVGLAFAGRRSIRRGRSSFAWLVAGWQRQGAGSREQGAGSREQGAEEQGARSGDSRSQMPTPVPPSSLPASFFVREHGRLRITPLLLVLLIVETTDLLFAGGQHPGDLRHYPRFVHRFYLEHLCHPRIAGTVLSACRDDGLVPLPALRSGCGAGLCGTENGRRRLAAAPGRNRAPAGLCITRSNCRAAWERRLWHRSRRGRTKRGVKNCDSDVHARNACLSTPSLWLLPSLCWDSFCFTFAGWWLRMSFHPKIRSAVGPSFSWFSNLQGRWRLATMMYRPWPLDNPPIVQLRPTLLYLNILIGSILTALATIVPVYWLRLQQRPFHFSLRSLFVLTTIVACNLAGLKCLNRGWDNPWPVDAWLILAYYCLIVARIVLVDYVFPVFIVLTAAHWLVMRSWREQCDNTDGLDSIGSLGLQRARSVVLVCTTGFSPTNTVGHRNTMATAVTPQFRDSIGRLWSETSWFGWWSPPRRALLSRAGFVAWKGEFQGGNSRYSPFAPPSLQHSGFLMLNHSFRPDWYDYYPWLFGLMATVEPATPVLIFR